MSAPKKMRWRATIKRGDRTMRFSFRASDFEAAKYFVKDLHLLLGVAQHDDVELSEVVKRAVSEVDFDMWGTLQIMSARGPFEPMSTFERKNCERLAVHGLARCSSAKMPFGTYEMTQVGRDFLFEHTVDDQRKIVRR